MGIGFRSFTDTGILQIDSSVKHLVFHSTGSLSSFTTFTSGISKQGTVTISGLIAPVFFIKEGHGVIRRVVKSGSDYTLTILTKTAVTSVVYYVFDVIPNSPTTGVGLRMFTADNELSYDSNLRPLTPKYLTSLDGAILFDVTAGKEYAISYSGFPLYGVFDSLVSDEIARYTKTVFFMLRASSTQLLVDDWFFSGASTVLGEYPPSVPGSIARSKLPVIASVIDVTGL